MADTPVKTQNSVPRGRGRFPKLPGFLDLWLVRFSMEDVAFAVLPVIVVWLVRALLEQPVENVLLLPELGFASIVILGAAIGHFIDLKVRYQRDLSFRVFGGTRAAVVLLIIAVLGLALVYIHEQGIAVNTTILGWLQLGSFVAAVFFIAVSLLFEERATHEREHLPQSLPKRRFFSYLIGSLESIESELDYARYILDCYKTGMSLHVGEDYYNSNLFNRQLAQDIQGRLTHIQEKMKAIEGEAQAGLLHSLQNEPGKQDGPSQKGPNTSATPVQGANSGHQEGDHAG